mmetsp:Transcript_21368/g.29953  ORF Transcript_21368/g.29953 Transcript_21368/m.29953 type:complete len:673 (+) Transcript_21368:37-2055(+)
MRRENGEGSRSVRVRMPTIKKFPKSQNYIDEMEELLHIIPTLINPSIFSKTKIRSRIIGLALISRILILMGMIFSFSIIPDFDAGDGVLSLNLRLSEKRSEGCFCLASQACDPMIPLNSDLRFFRGIKTPIKYHKAIEFLHGHHVKKCADREILNTILSHEETRKFDKFYELLLVPLTRWDAARFLTIAIYPLARYPDFGIKEEQDSKMALEVKGDPDFYFSSSEQHHAFLPLYPILIRYTSLFLVRSLPKVILPSTFEAVVVLSALFLNTFFFIGAAISLYELTFSLVYACHEMTDKSFSNQGNEKNSLFYASILSQITATIFCVNPASIFFTSAYSESTFAFLTFYGYLCFHKDYQFFATFLWAMASFTRSNGAISSLFQCLWIFGKIIDLVLVKMNRNLSARDFIETGKTWMSLGIECLALILKHLTLASIMIFPVIYHDQQGVSFHCTRESDASGPILNPNWCKIHNDKVKSIFGTFSLYSYVQKKHWNVGFMNYFQIRQIPNFLLAAPIILISICAVLKWIDLSLRQYIQIKRLNLTVSQIHEWIGFSLLRFVNKDERDLYHSTMKPKSKQIPCETKEKINFISTQLLLGPNMLAYYAILAGICFVGIFVAHVQISTRMISSSCPAIYWYMASLIIGKDSIRRILNRYFLIFNVLGLIMHVNWLPWT